MAIKWIRGEQWPVDQIDRLADFPITITEFDANELVAPHHLSGEGFPSPWSQALAFGARLRDWGVDTLEPTYQRECRQAVEDFLTLVLGQFSGILVPTERSWDELTGSRFGRLIQVTQLVEEANTPGLVMLRDERYTKGIAAINHPLCLWFPVYSYPVGALADVMAERIGRVEGDKLVPPSKKPPQWETQVGQLRSYLLELLETSGQRDDDFADWGDVVREFEHNLADLDVEPKEVPLQAGYVYASPPNSPAEFRTLQLRAFSYGGEGGRCSEHGRDWINHPYPQGILELDSKQRDVLCPQCNRPISGLRDLGEGGVFFDETEGGFVIWQDEPADVDGALGLPPLATRVSVVPGDPGRARFKFNQAIVDVVGRVVSRSQVLLEEVVEVPAFDLLPIDAELSHFVDWEQPVERDKDRRNSYRVRLKGGWQTFLWDVRTEQVPDLTKVDNVTLLLWPGFSDQNWRADTVVYYLSDQLSEKPPKLRCYWQDDTGVRRHAEIEGFDRELGVLHMEGRVESLEWRSVEGRAQGFFRPKRVETEDGTVRKARVALDFGTSHTTIAWKPDERDPEVVTFNNDAAAPVELIAPTDAATQTEVARMLNLLPFWPTQSDQRWLIPSELLHFPKKEYWTVPHDKLDPSLFGRITRDFKWFDDGGRYRAKYLTMVLRVALASLKSAGIRTVEFRATYPLAFDSQHIDSFDKILGEILEDLGQRSGISISFQGYCSESFSGLEACTERGGNIHCVIDFGGGTTDIAVRVHEEESEFRKPFIVDSVRVAGNDVLESLVADDGLLTALVAQAKSRGGARRGATKREQQAQIAKQLMLSDFRSTGSGQAPGFWNVLSHDHSDAAALFAARNRAFFDGILAYVVHLLHKAEIRLRTQGNLKEGETARVDIFLLGQGWGLLRLQTGKFQARPREYVEKRIEQLRQLMPRVRGEYDPRVIVPTDEVSNEPKLATSFGAAKINTAQLQQAHDLTGSTGRETVFGLDVEFYDGSTLKANQITTLRRRPITSNVKNHRAWDNFVQPILYDTETLPHIRELFGPDEGERKSWVEDRLNGAIEQQLGAQLAQGDALSHSAIGLLLEDLWARRLRGMTPPRGG